MNNDYEKRQHEGYNAEAEFVDKGFRMLKGFLVAAVASAVFTVLAIALAVWLHKEVFSG